MKSLLLGLLLLGISRTAMAVTTATTSTTFTVDNIKYTVSASATDEVTVSGTDDATLTSLTIPDEVTYDGTTYKVTAVGADAFEENTAITTVTFGKNVKTLNMDAFENCTALTSIDIPGTITTIGAYAFHGDTSLKTATLEEGVTSIGAKAFQGCTAMTDIYLPSTITTFGGTGTTPGQVLAICSSLKTIHLASGSKTLKVEDGVLFSYDGTTLISYPAAQPWSTTTGNYVVPQTVTTICDYAFGYSKLTNIVLPNQLTTLGSYILIGQTQNASGYKLGELTIPGSVTQIPDMCFSQSEVQSVVFLWDGTTDLTGATLNGLKSPSNVYIKKSVYDNHLKDLSKKVSRTYTYKIPIELNSTTNHWATRCRDYDVDLSVDSITQGIHAYIVPSQSNGTLTLSELTYIPSRVGTNHDEYVGVLVHIDDPTTTHYCLIGENDYTKGSSQTDADGVGTNLLVGTPVATYIQPMADGYKNYGLDADIFKYASGSGFVRYDRAYLHLPQSVQAKRIAIDAPATAIRQVGQDKASPYYYTLDGLRHSGEPQRPGIYVVNGHKVAKGL